MENSLPATVVSANPAVPGNWVLLVEDNETIAHLLEIYLGRLGLAVRWCQFGQQALEAFTEQPASIRLVVADCRLPDMDGREVCRRLRQTRADLPVLLMSGNVAIRNLAPLAPGAGIEFLAKPYSPAEFVARVQRILVEAA